MCVCVRALSSWDVDHCILCWGAPHLTWFAPAFPSWGVATSLCSPASFTRGLKSLNFSTQTNDEIIKLKENLNIIRINMLWWNGAKWRQMLIMLRNVSVFKQMHQWFIIHHVQFWSILPISSYPLVNQRSYWKLLIMVDFPVKNGDFPEWCWFTRG